MFFCEPKFVGNKIKQARVNAKLSQCSLAEKINLSEKHISNIERGLNLPSLDTFFKLCKILNLTLNDFGLDIEVNSNKDRTQLLYKIFSASDKEVKAYNAIINSLDTVITDFNYKK